MAGMVGSVTPFDSKSQSWEEYCEVLNHVFVANDVESTEKKRAILLSCVGAVEYQGPNQTNQDSIPAWLKHEEPNSTRQQQKVINQTPSPPEYTPTRFRGQRLKFLGSQNL